MPENSRESIEQDLPADQDPWQLIEELRQSEARYRLLAENATDMISRNTPAGVYLYVSPTCRSLLGYEPEEMVGHNVYDFVHPDDHAIVREARPTLLSPASSCRTVCRVLRKDGAYVWLEVTAKMVRDPASGAVSEIVGIARDISDRKRAEAEMREREQHYKLLSEMMSDYVFRVQVKEDGNLEMDFASENFTAITGRTLDETRSSASWVKIFHPDDLPAVGAFMGQIFTTGLPGEFECRTFLQNREERWVQIFARPEWDAAHHHVTTVVGAVRDITARKEAELALRVSEERYRNLVELAPDGIVLCTPTDDRIVLANSAMAQMIGLPTSDECVGRQIFEFVHPDSIPAIQQYLWEMRLSGQSALIAAEKVRGVDGAITDVEILATPFLLDGEPTTQFLIRDITERNLLTAQLQQFADIVNHMQVGLYVYHLEDRADDRSLRLVRANPTSTAMLGLNEAAILGWRIDEIFPNLRAHNIPHRFAEVVRTGEPLTVEEFFYEQNNLPMAVYAFKVFALPNDCVAVLFEDITERKRAETRLRERLQFESLSSDLSARFINLSAEAVDAQIYQGIQEMTEFLGVDRGTVVEFASGTYAARMIYSYAVEGVATPTATFVFDRSHWFAEVLQEGLPIVLRRLEDLPEIASVEREAWIREGIKSYLGVPLVASGQPIGFISFSTFRRDYSWSEESIQWVQLVGGILANALVRKRAEEERRDLLETIREQARRVQQIIDTLPEGVILLDVADAAPPRVISANPLGEQDLLTLAGIWVGETLTHLGNCPIQELLAAPPHGLWHELDTEEYAYQILARPIAPGGGSGAWVMVIRDVTRMREIERQAQQQERLAAVGQMAAGIAHDFNNIMAAIVLYSQMLSRAEGLAEHDRERMLVIDQQAHHATQLIQQILDFSRQAVFELRPLDLLSLLKDQIRLLERTLPENIHIRLEFAADEYVILGDSTRLQQVFMNLAVNARDAMPQGGTLSFSLTYLHVADAKDAPLPSMPGGDWVRVIVADTGEGIPPEVLPRLFTPFFTTKPPGKGTGLGLAQVHGLVSAHHGFVLASGEVQAGAAFILYFPAHTTAVTSSVRSVASELVMGQGETILVVEDNAATCAAIVESLEFLNYRALTAPHGREALRILDEHAEIALILSDVVMPEMGGLQLLAALQEKGAHTRVVFLTGHPSEDNLPRQGSDAYADAASLLAGWMLKPSNLETLSEAVARALALARDGGTR